MRCIQAWGPTLLMTSCTLLDTTANSPLDTTRPDSHPSQHHYNSVPKMTWGKNKEVKKYQQYYFSGAPNQKTLLYAKASGVQAVLDLRQPSEKTEREQTHVKLVQLEYYNVAVPDDGSFSTEIYSEIENILFASQETVFLIHHQKADIAAAWFSIYLSNKSNLNTSTAIGIANTVGLEDRKIETKLRKFLDEN